MSREKRNGNWDKYLAGIPWKTTLKGTPDNIAKHGLWQQGKIKTCPYTLFLRVLVLNIESKGIETNCHQLVWEGKSTAAVSG